MPIVSADSGQILYNNDFENQLDGWSSNGSCKLSVEKTIVHGGKGACFVTGRSGVADTAQQDVTDLVKFYGQGKYTIVAWVRTSDSFDTASMTIAIQVVSTNKQSTSMQGRSWATAGNVTVNSQTYTKIQATVDLKWVDSLDYAQFYIYSDATQDNSLADFYLDDCSMIKVGAVPFNTPPPKVIPKKPIDIMKIWWEPTLVLIVIASALAFIFPLSRWKKKKDE